MEWSGGDVIIAAGGWLRSTMYSALRIVTNRA
jgi:hypothetical protein